MMSYRFNVPNSPGPAPITPMVYVREKTVWQYKLISRDLEHALSEDELNAFGKEGWELASALPQGNVVHFYFKRPKD